MRIIAGGYKGKSLKLPPSSKTRPASDKVKGAIFNILGDISDANVLDLFAGSGSVGLEALSREARFCCFVEQDPDVSKILRENVTICQASHQSLILECKVEHCFAILERKNTLPFHLVFLDPPYDKNLVNSSLKCLSSTSLLAKEALIVIEHSPREFPKEDFFKIIDQRKYGQTYISFLKQKNS